jgi:hypothetical protein
MSRVRVTAGAVKPTEAGFARAVIEYAQDDWIRAFRLAGVPAYIWTPEDWSEIERVLARSAT